MRRRSFIRGAGLGAALLPFIPVLDARAGSGPKRLIVVWTSDGTVRQRWLPTGNETDFVLGPILEPLQRHQGDLVVIDGLHNPAPWQGPGDAHQQGAAGALSAIRLLDGDDFTYETDVEGEPSMTLSVGWGGGISIDQLVAKEWAAPTTYRSLEFGVQTLEHDLYSRICYSGPAQPIPPEDDPVAMFDRLFADLQLDPAQQQRIRDRRQSVIDMVAGELTTLRGRLGGTDRDKMDAHLEAIREVEKTLSGSLSGCEPPDRAGFAADLGQGVRHDPNLYVAAGQAQTQLLAMAIRCDLTRVASLQWSNGASGVPFHWLGLDIENDAGEPGGGHHDLSHAYINDPALYGPQLETIYRFYAERFAELVDALKAIPEGEGTAFDTTAIVWVSDMGEGWGHGYENIPVVIAAGADSGVRPGRFVQASGATVNDLYVGLCHALGLDHVGTFGDPAYNSGPLPGLV